MADVFISYSRKDIQFAQRIHHELEARDRPWVDWQDIPPTSEWLDEVYAGIQAADTFLFIISPDSVASEICTLEIEHAVKHNKRLIPVVWKEVEDSQVHSAMTAHNWVFLRPEDDFEANFELLIQALDTDLEHVREHTRLLTRAIEWDQDQRSKGLALSRQELTMAEGWLTQGVSKEPRPAELHSEYIAFSRATVAGWQKLMISSVAVAVIFLSGFSFLQRQQAVKQKLVAEQQRLRAEEIARISTSRALAAFALAEMETDLELSLLLATKSVRIMPEANEIVLPLSNGVLRQSIIKSKVRLALTGHDSKVYGGRVRSVAYSPDGQRIVTGSEDRTAKIWDAKTGQELLTLTGHDNLLWSAGYSPDGQRIVTAGEDGIVQIYTTDMDELLQIADSRVTRQLTAEEKETYGVLDLN